MSDIIVHIEHGGETRLVAHYRSLGKSQRQSSVFEYADDWLGCRGAFALDPANLSLESSPIYTSSVKSALPGAMRDTALDRWGQQLVRRAFRKSGKARSVSESDYLLAINDQTRIGALRYKLQGSADFVPGMEQYRVPPLIQLSALLNAAMPFRTIPSRQTI